MRKCTQLTVPARDRQGKSVGWMAFKRGVRDGTGLAWELAGLCYYLETSSGAQSSEARVYDQVHCSSTSRYVPP